MNSSSPPAITNGLRRQLRCTASHQLTPRLSVPAISQRSGRISCGGLTKDDPSVGERRWHDSLVDVRAQTDIILDPRFIPWSDREVSIRTVDKIFADAVTREWKKTMEPQCNRNLEGATDKKGNLLDRDQKVAKCKTSTMGCPQPGCDEHICKKCWAKGYV